MNDSAICGPFIDLVRETVAERGPSVAHTLAISAAKISAKLWHLRGNPYRRSGKENHYGWWNR